MKDYKADISEIQEAIDRLHSLLNDHQETLKANLIEKKLHKNEHYLKCRNHLLSSLIHLKNLKSSLEDERYWS